MSPRARLVVASVAVACLFMAPAVHAQAITGTIEGTVTDEDGGNLPGVTVTIINTATGYEGVLTTSASGFFQAPQLPLGPYAVTFELEGFATLIREGLDLALGQTITLRIQLQLSTVGEEITVTDAAPLIETSRTEGQIRIDERSLEGLPNDGRDFLAFSKLTPGVTIVQGPDGEELSINGQKGINNNVMVDGADFNNPFFGEQRGGQRPAFTFNIDAVKDMVIITDGAPAEFGRSSGGFVNVITKSGTNSLRGSAHVFFKNDSLPSANPQLRGGGREPDSSFDQTQLGFTLGGPLKKDKLFFFLAADQQRADQTKQTDPDRIRADVVDFLASVGLPNENAPITRTDDGDAYLAKLDYQVNDSNLFTARWAYHYSQQVNGTFDVDSWGASANAIETDYAHGYTASLFSNLADNKLNEFRGQYAKEWRPRPYDGPQVPGQDRPFPDTAFDFALGVRVGLPFFIPVVYDDDRIQLNDNFSLLRGNHSFKAGIEYNDITSSQTFIGFANGRYIFSSFDGFRNYVNFGPGYVECADADFGNFNTSTNGTCAPGTGIVGPLLLYLQQAGVGGLSVEEAGTQALGQKENAIFIQDQWRPRPNITVEMGLRWELMDQPDVITPPSEVFFAPLIGTTVDSLAGPVTFPSDGTIPDDDVLQPRFAMSYTPKDNTNQVFRFNVGLFAARTPALTLASVRSTNGSRGQTLFRNSETSPFLTPSPVWPNILPASAVGSPFNPDVYVFDKDFVLPRTWSTSLSWENEYKPNWALLVKANYAKTDHITRWTNRNDALIGSPWAGSLPGGNGLGALNVVESSAKSRYWGLTLGLNKRWSDNYQFQAYYTFSEDKSDDDNERDPFSIRYANLTNLGPEFGLSDRHQENRFNFWMSWLAPYDINVNVRLTYLDAQPLDVAPDGGLTTFPPNQRCIGGCTIGGEVFQRNQGKKDNEFQTIDLRLSKDFQVGAWTVQPVVDVFNLTDEPNFLVPSVGELIFNFDGTVRSGGGDPREIQVGVRLLK